MKLCIIGTGYVGLVSGACLADAGNTVFCVDKDAQKIEILKQGRIPIHEPGLAPVVERNIRESRLFFTADFQEGVRQADMCFICVDTPPDSNGKANLTNVLAVAQQLGRSIDSSKIIVTKSTVPVGTTAKVKKIIFDELVTRGLDPKKLLHVANNPEFLKEGDAVNDFMKPNRVIVGVENDHVAEKLHVLYMPFMRRGDRFLRMDIASSELTKYAANAMLATRISFMNELARLCERVGADISHLRNGLGMDPRIGPDFLYAGVGYGGSCFPKDMKALIGLGNEHQVSMTIPEAVDKVNNEQREWFWKKIEDGLGGRNALTGKKVSMWGLAFKANTDDVRCSPSLFFIEKLLNAGCVVAAYDPEANESARLSLAEKADRVRFCESSYGCVEGADALIVCTECREFRSPDFERVLTLMKHPLIFDGRLLYDPQTLSAKGFTVISVGRCFSS